MWPHCRQKRMLRQPHHHESLLYSVHLVYQVVLLVLSGLQLGKVIFHCQKIWKLRLFRKRIWSFEELDFTLCTNITRSDQVLIITWFHVEYICWAPPFLYVSISFYTSIFTWLTCFCGLARTFCHLLSSSTSWWVVLLVGYSPSLLYTLDNVYIYYY